MTHRLFRRTATWLFFAAIGLVATAGCGRVGGIVTAPVRFVGNLLPVGGAGGEESTGAALGSPREARQLIERTIAAHRGERVYQIRDGRELNIAIKSVVGGREIEDPALVQMTLGPQPRIRIHYTKIDHVYSVGDQGPWAMVKGQPEDDPKFVASANYTAKMMCFFLSAPYNLTQKNVVPRGVGPVQWGGRLFDAVKIGFKDDSLLWPEDELIVWIDRASGLIDRFFYKSTNPAARFEGEPPHHILIRWSNYRPLDGIPLARNWEFLLTDAQGEPRESIYNLEIVEATANRDYLPVLFRKPVFVPPESELPILEKREVTPVINP